MNPRATPGFYSVKTESMQPTIDLVDAAAARMQRLRRQLRANARPPVVVVRGGTEEAQVTGDRARTVIPPRPIEELIAASSLGDPSEPTSEELGVAIEQLKGAMR